MRPIGDWSTTMTVDVRRALDGVVSADGPVPAALAVQEGPADDVRHQRGLPGPGDAGHAGQRAERDLDVDTLEVVGARSAHPEGEPVPLAALGRHRDLQLAAQVLGGEAAAVAHQLGVRSLEDDAPALLPRSRPEVDDVVRDLDDRPVVLDDEHGVALVAQGLEDVDQPARVAGWRPMDGSSSMQRVPTSPVPSAVASAMRCASPRRATRTRGPGSDSRGPRPSGRTAAA